MKSKNVKKQARGFLGGVLRCLACSESPSQKNVKPLKFFILLSPFGGQLAFDLLWAPEPLNGATRPNTGLDRPTGRGCLLAVYWQSAREPQGRNFGPRESILRAGSLTGV
jgi:hypothetical protein